MFKGFVYGILIDNQTYVCDWETNKGQAMPIEKARHGIFYLSESILEAE